MTSPRRVALALALALSAWACLARAEELRVVLAGPSARHPTVVRVRDELRLLGLEVEVVAPAVNAGDLAALAREHGAAAAARVDEAPPGIVVWVDPERSGGGRRTEEERKEQRAGENLGPSPEPELLALRAVELLRARLIPVPPGAPRAPATEPPATEPPPAPTPEAKPAPEAPAPADPAPPPPASRPEAGPAVPSAAGAAPSAPPLPERPGAPPGFPSGVEGTERRASLSAGGALGFGPGGLPPALLARLGVGWRALPRLRVEGTALLPLGEAGAQSERGGVHLRMLPLLAGLTLEAARPAPGLDVLVGGGAGAAWLLFEGEAAPPFEPASGSRWVAALHVSAGLGYRLGRHLGLRADLLGAFFFPEPVLRVAGREVARVGRPAAFASVGLEVWP